MENFQGIKCSRRLRKGWRESTVKDRKKEENNKKKKQQTIVRPSQRRVRQSVMDAVFYEITKDTTATKIN